MDIIKYRIERLQKRLEYCIVKERNYYRRFGVASEKVDKEIIQYMGIINELREELASSLEAPTPKEVEEELGISNVVAVGEETIIIG